MVDVSLRDKKGGPRPGAVGRPRSHWGRPLGVTVLSLAVIVILGGLVHVAIEVYHRRLTVTGLSSDVTPIVLSIAGERLTVPANHLRFAETRVGGEVRQADLVFHWPTLDGYSDALAEDFKDGSPRAPLIFATLAPRQTPLDATARLDQVYARFFVGEPLAGPAGLVGRRLGADSGYDGEIVYYFPDGPRPFVARCFVESTAEMPATCLRDINLGRGLALLYRFNRDLLDEWRTLDTGIRRLAAGFLDPVP